MSAPVDPEFRLAAACCRWPPGAARNAAVCAAAARVDWARFGQVVRRQRIAGLTARALGEAGVAPPPAIAGPIAHAAQQIVRQNLVAAAETARVTDVIAAAGHHVLAVKGVVLGALAYGSIALKHSKDVDLLVVPDDLEAIIALLERDGYQLTLPGGKLTAAQRRTLSSYGKDVSLRKPGGTLQIELHWRLLESRALLPGVTARSAVQRVTLGGGRSVPTLAQPALYAYLVLHGASDGWSRLKWLADVNALLAPLDGAAVSSLHQAAVALGAGTASAQALLLIHDLFGRDLPRDIAPLEQQPWRVRMIVAGAHRLMTPPDGARETADWWPGQKLVLAMQILLAPGVYHGAQLLRSVLYLQAGIYESRLPPRLYPLYPLIRVPVWSWRRIRLGVAKLARRGKSATLSAKTR